MTAKDMTELKIALGIENLPEADQEEILAKADKRLEDVVLRVLIENLSDDEARRMREILGKGDNIENEVAQITAGVPALAERIENAVALEIDRLKKVLSA